jgi:hypothetical protein
VGGTCPKWGARLPYCLVLGPLIENAPHLGNLPYTRMEEQDDHLPLKKTLKILYWWKAKKIPINLNPLGFNSCMGNFWGSSSQPNLLFPPPRVPIENPKLFKRRFQRGWRVLLYYNTIEVLHKSTCWFVYTHKSTYYYITSWPMGYR